MIIGIKQPKSLPSGNLLTSATGGTEALEIATLQKVEVGTKDCVSLGHSFLLVCTWGIMSDLFLTS